MVGRLPRPSQVPQKPHVQPSVALPGCPHDACQSIGRYVFQPEIFEALDKIGVGKGGEYQLTDAMRLLCRKGGLYGLRFKGRRFEIGSKADYVRAAVALSMERQDLGDELGQSLESLVKRR